MFQSSTLYGEGGFSIAQLIDDGAYSFGACMWNVCRQSPVLRQSILAHEQRNPGCSVSDLEQLLGMLAESRGDTAYDLYQALTRAMGQLYKFETDAPAAGVSCYWLYIESGVYQFRANEAGEELPNEYTWADPRYNQPVGGHPARAVLLVTPQQHPGPKDSLYNIDLFELGYDGLPTGRKYPSPTWFEMLTDRAARKKPRESFRVLIAGEITRIPALRPPRTRDCKLEIFLEHVYGPDCHKKKSGTASRQKTANIAAAATAHASNRRRRQSSSAIPVRSIGSRSSPSKTAATAGCQASVGGRSTAGMWMLSSSQAAAALRLLSEVSRDMNASAASYKAALAEHDSDAVNLRRCIQSINLVAAELNMHGSDFLV